MKVFKKVLKNKLFYLFILLGVFVIPIFKFNLHAQEEPLPVYSDKNLTVPDLVDKEYLGDGNYRLYNDRGITVDYNVNSGRFVMDGIIISISTGTVFRIPILEEGLTYTITREYISGTKTDNFSVYIRTPVQLLLPLTQNQNTFVAGDNNDDIIFSDITIGTAFDNYTFTLQIEKGDTATPYTVPLQPYLWHEKRLSYDDGFDNGYDDGFDNGYELGYPDGESDGYDNGYNQARNEYAIFINDEWVNAADYGELQYNEARDEYGIYINDEWLSAIAYGDIQYNEARAEYGIYINDEWLTAVDYGELQYNDGYQDGVDDTHDYYNDNGLFIPKLTPKAHLVIDYDLRYGEPYFYLQDFYNVDDVYFGYLHNRWLEKAFDWAYSVEEDFLAINDIYMIPYEHDTQDEMLYKYFFYKYDTDSIYFYNDNGTLLKIVERVDFDYYVYEVPELSQEEQARIDNAYNKGMRDYGYYDSESEEYLTAAEYGDIQYNLGVQSTRDRAYSDGFVVAMWYSHLYGYDWLHATYYDLISERPLLYNVSDITSFSYGVGYDDGFDVGNDVGYDRGYDWGYEDGYDIGYDDGEDAGYEDGYYKGYQVAVDNTYDTIYDDIYKIGYKDGQKTGMNNKFYSGLEKWIVPALIVVLFFGLLMFFPKNKED